MKAKDILLLADRCSSAIGSDRRLDAEIFCAVGQDSQAANVTVGGRPLRGQPDGGDGRVKAWDRHAGCGWSLDAPEFTSSIDATMMLMPKGFAWMHGCAPDYLFFATLSTTDEAEAAGAKPVQIDNIKADTPSLALLSAILRAIAAGQS